MQARCVSWVNNDRASIKRGPILGIGNQWSLGKTAAVHWAFGERSIDTVFPSQNRELMLRLYLYVHHFWIERSSIPGHSSEATHGTALGVTNAKLDHSDSELLSWNTGERVPFGAVAVLGNKQFLPSTGDATQHEAGKLLEVSRHAACIHMQHAKCLDCSSTGSAHE